MHKTFICDITRPVINVYIEDPNELVYGKMRNGMSYASFKNIKSVREAKLYSLGGN